MTVPSRGWVTIAVRSRRYLEMAVDLRLSMKQYSPRPMALGADEALARVAKQSFPQVFDEVRVLDSRFDTHRAMTIGAGQVSPFEETIFVDADCLVLGDPEFLWPDAGSPAIIMHGDELTTDADVSHHGFSTRELMKRFDLKRYLKSNAGVFYLRGDEGRAHLEECLRVYVEEVLPSLSVGPGFLGVTLRSLLGGFLGAELAFGIVGGRRGFGTFPPPGPMYWPEDLAQLDPRCAGKPILHWLGPLPREGLQWLLEEVERRRAEAGVPSNGSEHWLQEDHKLRKAALRR